MSRTHAPRSGPPSVPPRLSPQPAPRARLGGGARRGGPASADGLGSGNARGASRGPRLPRARSSTSSPGTADPLDGARASLVFVQHGGSSTFVLAVSGVGAAGIGHTYGAHLHTGPCVAGDGAAAGPHYNQSTVDGIVPPVVNDRTEVWLDVTIGADGTAVAVATVPFVPTPGNRAVVVHAAGTDDHGTAGARLGLPAGELVMTAVRYAASGLVLGVAWAVAGRVWMRLIATEPAFTWAGTLLLVGMAALVGLALGLVHAARRRGASRWWRVLYGVVPVLFAGAGLPLLPAVVLGGWGLRRGALGRRSPCWRSCRPRWSSSPSPGTRSAGGSCPTRTPSTGPSSPPVRCCSPAPRPGGQVWPSDRGGPQPAR